MAYYILSLYTPPDNLCGFLEALARIARANPATLAILGDSEAELAAAEGEVAALRQAEDELRAAKILEGNARRAKNDSLKAADPEYVALRRQLKVLAQHESKACGLTLESLSSFPSVVRPAALPTQLQALVTLAAVAADRLARAGYDDARFAQLSLLAETLRADQARLTDATAKRRNTSRDRKAKRAAVLRRAQRLDAFLGESPLPEVVTELQSQRQTWLKKARPAKAATEGGSSGG